MRIPIVRLHFAEIYHGATGGGAGGIGRRVFNVTGEGQALLTNFDIYAEAGTMTALVKEFEIPVTDGTLNLSFIRTVGNPKVSAIEVTTFPNSSNLSGTAMSGSLSTIYQNSSKSNNLIKAYPNPFNNILNLRFPSEKHSQEYKIKVLDVLGRILQHSVFITDAGEESIFQLDLSDKVQEPAGLYMVEVECKLRNYKEIFKLIKSPN